MARPREYDPDVALEKAMRAFWTGGYESTSVDALCAAMAMRPASLYGAFGGKRALFLKALDSYTARSQAAFAEVSRSGGLAGLHAFFGRLVDRLSDDAEGSGCLVTNSATELARRDPDVAAAVTEHWQRLGVMLSELLRQAQQRGELAPGAGPASGPALLCLAQGLNVMAKTRPERAALQAIVDAALAPMLRRD
jgi:TetR/AcrR family transcriptional regulator, transcriptional repressor for nem operon